MHAGSMEEHCRQSRVRLGYRAGRSLHGLSGVGATRWEVGAVSCVGPGATRGWSFILSIMESAGRSWWPDPCV